MDFSQMDKMLSRAQESLPDLPSLIKSVENPSPEQVEIEMAQIEARVQDCTLPQRMSKGTLSKNDRNLLNSAVCTNESMELLFNDHWLYMNETCKQAVRDGRNGFMGIQAAAHSVGKCSLRAKTIQMMASGSMTQEVTHLCSMMNADCSKQRESFTMVSSSNIALFHVGQMIQKKMEGIKKIAAKIAKTETVKPYEQESCFEVFINLEEELKDLDPSAQQVIPSEFVENCKTLDEIYDTAMAKMLGGDSDDVKNQIAAYDAYQKEILEVREKRLDSTQKRCKAQAQVLATTATITMMNKDATKWEAFIQGREAAQASVVKEIALQKTRIYKNQRANWHAISYDEEIEGDEKELIRVIKERDALTSQVEELRKNQGKSLQEMENKLRLEVGEVGKFDASIKHHDDTLATTVEKGKKTFSVIMDNPTLLNMKPENQAKIKAGLAQTKTDMEQANSAMVMGNKAILQSRVAITELRKMVEVAKKGLKTEDINAKSEACEELAHRVQDVNFWAGKIDIRSDVSMVDGNKICLNAYSLSSTASLARLVTTGSTGCAVLEEGPVTSNLGEAKE